MSVLADASVWIDYLKLGQRGPGAALDRLLARNDVSICGPVAAEVMVGTPTGLRWGLWATFDGLIWIDADRNLWRQVGEVAGALRDRGTPVPLTDVQIAVAAVEAGAELWTRDADFDQIAVVLPALRRFQPA